jgi:2-dehydro-3-deoxyphosphogluconate aldolase/(4S)-4-hydroxy-2-oxoglutarate aldolase
MVAVGGVSLENLKDYFRAGAAGVGVGPALFGADALVDGNLKEIAENVGRFVEAAMEATN